MDVNTKAPMRRRSKKSGQNLAEGLKSISAYRSLTGRFALNVFSWILDFTEGNNYC